MIRINVLETWLVKVIYHVNMYLMALSALFVYSAECCWMEEFRCVSNIPEESGSHAATTAPTHYSTWQVCSSLHFDCIHLCCTPTLPQSGGHISLCCSLDVFLQSVGSDLKIKALITHDLHFLLSSFYPPIFPKPSWIRPYWCLTPDC